MHDVTEVHEVVVGMLEAHVPVPQRRDVQVGRHLLDAHAAVDATCRSVGDLVVRGAVSCLPLLGGTEGEQPLDAVQASPLIRGAPARGGDDVGRGGWVWAEHAGYCLAAVEDGLGFSLGRSSWRLEGDGKAGGTGSSGSICEIDRVKARGWSNTHAIFDKLVAKMQAIAHRVPQVDTQVRASATPLPLSCDSQ